jgi:hypothetical protein
MACSLLFPHISALGTNDAQTAGLPACPKILHRLSSLSCTQRTPAGLPLAMPGMGLEMEGAMQHAPHPGLQGMAAGGIKSSP